MIKQTTVANKVSCSGIGLHGGKPVRLSLCPAPANTGIIFRRLDVPGSQAMVPVTAQSVCDTRLGTTIINKHGIQVAVVEHLMAALWGAGVDNVIVELNGPEVPIMDGSSEPFLFVIDCAGIKQLSAPRKILRVLKHIEVSEGKSIAGVRPNREGDEGCVLSIEIEFDNKMIHRQRSHYDFRETTFKQSLARARTFGFEEEVESLRANGLAQGGSLDNAVVVGKDRILNEEGLRYHDEFVRHKALDCLGDLYLAGLRIDGHFSFIRPGHCINNRLLKTLLADESAYEIVAAGKLTQPAYPAIAAAASAYA